MNFDAKSKDIKELFSDNVFRVPINQRAYVWTETNWKDLLTDIFLVCDESTSGHFIGSIVLEQDHEENAIKYYKIIDGQQRIITLTILLSALYNIYLNFGLTKESEAIKKYCFAFNSNNEKFFVVENGEIGLKEMIEEVFEKKEPFDFLWIETSLKNKTNANIFNAFNYFFNNINNVLRKKGKDLKRYLTKIFKTIISLSYINIVSSAEEDSFTIFEILNARGQRLEDHELLKNLLLKYSTNKEHTIKTWETILKNLTINGKCHIKNFIKHYSIHKFKSENNKSPYLTIKESIDKNDITNVVTDLYKKSLIYKQFIAPQELDSNEFQKPIYEFFYKNKQTQYRPILMSLTSQYNNGKLDQKIFHSTLSFLKKFFICFTLISLEKSNKIENVIYKYSSLLENNFSIELLNEMLDSLKRKFPSKELFSKRLETLAWSRKNDSPYHETKNKEKIIIVFDLIEEFYLGRLPVIEYTIEHINSDDGGDINSKIGNLLPLEEKLNLQCDSKSFSEKLKIYSSSFLNTPRQFSQRYSSNNTAFDINKRHDYLVKTLYEEILKI